MLVALFIFLYIVMMVVTIGIAIAIIDPENLHVSERHFMPLLFIAFIWPVTAICAGLFWICLSTATMVSKLFKEAPKPPPLPPEVTKELNELRDEVAALRAEKEGFR